MKTNKNTIEPTIEPIGVFTASHSRNIHDVMFEYYVHNLKLNHGNETLTCEKIGINRRTTYRWRKERGYKYE